MWKSLRTLALIVWLVFVVLLTTEPGSFPLVHLTGSTIGSTEAGAALGHAGLFFILTFIFFVALRLCFSSKIALMAAMTAALLLATTTEIYQMGVPDRSSSLADLLANWLGIFIVGFAVSFIRAYDTKRVHS